ncbi:MAG: cytochrome P450, partial [Microvirga sp.]
NAFFRPYVTAEIVSSAEAAAGRLQYYIEELAGRDHDRRENDFLPAYLDVAENGERHSRIEALMQIVQLIIGGTESMRIAIVAQTANLLARPGLWDAVCVDPKLVPSAVAESLRFEPGIAGLVRISLDNIVIGDRVLPRDELVVLSSMSALRDERKFDRPDEFDIFRQDGGLTNLAFGAGAHKCVADAMARAALEEALSALTERLPRARLVKPPVFQGHIFVRGSSECRIAWVP